METNLLKKILPYIGFLNIMQMTNLFELRKKQMALRKTIYPKSLKDIPSWRRREITQDLLWFSKYSPADRLRFVDQEWKEIQKFINLFGLKKHGTRKRI